MPLTPVSLLKAQLNLDHDADDALLTHKLDTAEAWIFGHIGKTLTSLPPTVTEAVLQLAAYWYAQREAALIGESASAVPFGVRDLLSSHREAVTGHVPE